MKIILLILHLGNFMSVLSLPTFHPTQLVRWKPFSRPLVPGLQAITKFVTELPPERLEDLQNLFRVQDWYLDFAALLRLSNTEVTLQAPTTKRM